MSFKFSDEMRGQKRRITTLLERTGGRSWSSCEGSLQPLNRNVMPKPRSPFKLRVPSRDQTSKGC